MATISRSIKSARPAHPAKSGKSLPAVMARPNTSSGPSKTRPASVAWTCRMSSTGRCCIPAANFGAAATIAIATTASTTPRRAVL